MWGSPVVSAALWAVAVAAAVWILVPAIAFALGVGGARTEVLPEVGPPPLHAEDSVFAPRARDLAALGFRAAGQTRERGLFVSPTQWRWQSYQSTQWLVSPDGCTYANLYRLVPGEPARLSAVTLLEGGRIVRTACPGGPTEVSSPSYRRIALRGVGAAELLAAHQQQVEAFAREQAATVQPATVAEIAAADIAAERPLTRKMAAAGYALLAAFAPVAFLVPTMPDRVPSSVIALGVCVQAGFYALVRWLVQGPLLRQVARRSHTEDQSAEPTQVPPDGEILPIGAHERLLRVLAGAGALLACPWPVAFTKKLFVITRAGGFGVILQLAYLAMGLAVVAQLVNRARGKRSSPWSMLLILDALVSSHLDWSQGTLHRILGLVAGASVLIAFAGWYLEGRRAVGRPAT